jgi:hypothetical protein
MLAGGRTVNVHTESALPADRVGAELSARASWVNQPTRQILCRYTADDRLSTVDSVTARGCRAILSGPQVWSLMPGP